MINQWIEHAFINGLFLGGMGGVLIITLAFWVLDRHQARSTPVRPATPKPKADALEQFRRQARAAEMPTARTGICQLSELFGGEVIILLFDDHGRVFQALDGQYVNVSWSKIMAPREQITRLMDRFGTVDFDPAAVGEVE